MGNFNIVSQGLHICIQLCMYVITRAAPKVMPIFYDVGPRHQRLVHGWTDYGWTILPASIPSHVVAVWQIAAEGQTDRMAPDMEVHMKQRCVVHEHAMQDFVHCWWKCAANGVNYVEKQCFAAENVFYQALLCSLYLL